MKKISILFLGSLVFMCQVGLVQTITKLDTDAANSNFFNQKAKKDTMVVSDTAGSAKVKQKPKTAQIAKGVDTTGTISADSLNLLKEMMSKYDNQDSSKQQLPWHRVVKNSAFKVGEKLTFVIRYGPIHAGNSVMKIPEIIEYKGRKCYRIVTTANSNKFFSTFYRVEDRVESYMDVESLFSWHFEKHLREGNYKSDRYIDYDQRNHLAMTEKDTVMVPHYVQDILSALYFARTQDLKVGVPLQMENYTDGKLYPLFIKVYDKEKVKTRAGTFNCLVVEPLLRTEGIFHQKGRLWVYLTDDEKKIPVMMKSKIIIGHVTAELIKMEGVN